MMPMTPWVCFVHLRRRLVVFDDNGRVGQNFARPRCQHAHQKPKTARNGTFEHGKHHQLTHRIHVFTYIWLISMVNAGKYTIHGSYG